MARSHPGGLPPPPFTYRNPTRIEPLRLLARTSGPPPPTVPDAAPFDVEPCSAEPSTDTEPEPLRASSVSFAFESKSNSKLPDPPVTCHGAVGRPLTRIRPLLEVATSPPFTPMRSMALDAVPTSTVPFPRKVPSVAPLCVRTGTRG